MSVATLPNCTAGTAWKALIVESAPGGYVGYSWSVDGHGAPNHAAAIAALGLTGETVCLRITAGGDVTPPAFEDAATDSSTYNDVFFWLRSACKYG